MGGGSGGGVFYSTGKKTRFPGNGAEAGDLFGRGLGGEWSEAVGISAWVFAGGADGGGAAEGDENAGGTIQGVGVSGGKCELVGS